MIFLLAILVLAVLYAVFVYNSLVTLRTKTKEAWSDIDVQLKRRYNLIPNIVETVKGFAAHEEGVFTKVTEARAKAINASSMQDHEAAENMLSGALKSLFAVAENYPQLKANENFLQLQNELVDTEDKIQSSRRFYNGNVRDLNIKIDQFPSNIIANVFKFMKEEFFELEGEEEKKNVAVSFKKEEAPKQEPPKPEPPKAEPPQSEPSAATPAQ